MSTTSAHLADRFSLEGRLVLLTAIPVEPGALFSAGPLGTEVARMIVFSVEPHADLTATLTLVDEAPRLWA